MKPRPWLVKCSWGEVENGWMEWSPTPEGAAAQAVATVCGRVDPPRSVRVVELRQTSPGHYEEVKP